MPIYEYQCNHCGQYSEFLQKVSDAPIRQCPHCKNESLEKRISAASFHLKGSGWYVTDFKDKAKTSSDGSKKTDDKDKKETTSDTTAQTEPTPSKTEKKPSEE